MSTAAVADVVATALARDGQDWIVPRWPVPAGVAVFSTTRNGGVSAGTYASLNLGATMARRRSGDDPLSVAQNRARVQVHLPSQPVWLDQVHGGAVHVATREGAATPPTADAAVTRERNVVLAVLTADCLPLVLADRGGSAVGIAHCGWRGLAAGVVENTLRTMALPAADVVAWMGPAIGPDAFEVGADVRDVFLMRDAADAGAFRPKGTAKWWADIYALARRRLLHAGVSDVHGGELCTVTDAQRFFSFRRDGETGRMATFAWRR